MEEYYEVRHYITNEIIHCGEDESFKKFIEQAVKNDVNLSYADLSGLNLQYAIIRSAKVEGANFNNTDLTHVIFYDAILYDAKDIK